MTFERSIGWAERRDALDEFLKKKQRYRITDYDGLTIEADYGDIAWDEEDLVLRLRNATDPEHKSWLDGSKRVYWEVSEVQNIEPVTA